MSVGARYISCWLPIEILKRWAQHVIGNRLIHGLKDIDLSLPSRESQWLLKSLKVRFNAWRDPQGTFHASRADYRLCAYSFRLSEYGSTFREYDQIGSISTYPDSYTQVRIIYIMLNRAFGHTVTHRGLTHRHTSGKLASECPIPEESVYLVFKYR